VPVAPIVPEPIQPPVTPPEERRVPSAISERVTTPLPVEAPPAPSTEVVTQIPQAAPTSVQGPAAVTPTAQADIISFTSITKRTPYSQRLGDRVTAGAAVTKGAKSATVNYAFFRAPDSEHVIGLPVWKTKSKTRGKVHRVGVVPGASRGQTLPQVMAKGYRLIGRLFQSVLREQVVPDIYSRAEKQARVASQRLSKALEVKAQKAKVKRRKDEQPTLFDMLGNT